MEMKEGPRTPIEEAEGRLGFSERAVSLEERTGEESMEASGRILVGKKEGGGGRGLTKRITSIILLCGAGASKAVGGS